MEFTRTATHRFHLLDGLRGIAALLVAVRHAPPQLVHVFPVYNSFLAVDFFFCLSGFVIAYSYEDRLKTRMNLRDFLAVRVIRLYPLAALGTVIFLLTGITGHLYRIDTPYRVSFLIVLALLALPNFSSLQSGILFPFNAPEWSLFYEMLANLAYGALVRCRLARTWVLGSVALASFALLAASAIWHGDFGGGTTRDTFYLGLARVGYSFFAGVCLFRLHQRSTQTVIQGPGALVASTAIVAILIATFTVSTSFTRSATFDLVVAVVLFPFVVHLSSRIEPPARWIAACAFLGDMSYPLYITHAPLLSPLNSARFGPLFSRHEALLPWAAVLLFAFLCCFSVWLAKHFDYPVRKSLTAKYTALTNDHLRARETA